MSKLAEGTGGYLEAGHAEYVRGGGGSRQGVPDTQKSPERTRNDTDNM